MSQSLLLDLYLNRTQSMRRTLENWPAEHESAPSVLTVREVIHECLDFPDSLMRLWETTFQRISDRDLLPDVYTLRDELADIFDAAIAAMTATRQLADDSMKTTGKEIADVRNLDSAMEKVKRLKEEIFRYWPRVTPQDLLDDQADIERGDGLEGEMAFAQMAGVDLETWRNRVEEHKRKYHSKA